MTHKTTIAALLAAAGEMAGEQARHESRRAARAAWLKERIAALKAAQRRVFDAWDRIFDALPDNIDEEELEAMDIPDPPEQAELAAIHAEVDAVRDHDKWPRKLHWGDI
ncbi:MAG: hypothetical protein AB7I42_29870 [Bradyrhizobium sp.]|uniref:hypothetical protein n=1 Tax=Bradyrhizobium sp. TaxID=376 RepID=UPI003D0968C7